MPPNLGFDRWPRRPADGTPTCAHKPGRYRTPAGRIAGKKHRGCGGQNHHVRGQLSELPVSADKEGGPEIQAPTPEFSCTTARAQTRTHTDSHALLLGILDSTCQTGDMGPSRSTPRSACASTHPRSRRSSPPPLPLYTQTLSRRPDGGTAEPHLRGSRRPTSTTSAAMSRAGRRRSILGSLRAATAKKASLSPS